MADILHYVVINVPVEKVYGAVLKFRFGSRYYNEMKVLKLEENKYVEWESIIGADEWIGTKISFDIETDGGKTNLRFSHRSWKEKTDFFAQCNYHWGHYMKSIKSLCETGKGTPYSEPAA